MKVWAITNERGEHVRYEENPELELASLQVGEIARVFHRETIVIPGGRRELGQLIDAVAATVDSEHRENADLLHLLQKLYGNEGGSDE